DEAQVVASLDRIGRKYSRDVISFYCITGGMKDSESDSYCLSFWPLDEVVGENSSYTRPHILFADFLIHSYCYCFRYENAECSSVCVELFDDSEPELIAESIDEFFDLYLRSPKKLGVYFE
ncbi:MAG TPA: hypothetical protein VGA87_05610, partial [Pyrinomonadaceae bacterium]